MGFFTRLLGLKQEDEEEGGARGGEGERSINLNSQNHNNHGERRLPRLFVLGIYMYKAVKGLLRKVGSIFYHAKPAHPLLPLQNPATTQPLLLPAPTISSPTYAFSDDDDDDDDDRVLWNYPAKTDHYVACASTSDEMARAAVFVEECAWRYFPLMEEKTTEGEGEGEGEEEEELEEEKEEEEEVNRVIVVVEERWIKHYSSGHRMLLVGEGNFSFSACLAKAFRCASNIIATSLDSQAFLKEHYRNALSNIEELRSRGSKVLHGIDATTMADHHLLRHLKFDRIVYNFPYAGLQTLKSLPRQTQLEHHRRLVRQFMENAREMISEEGEIHITHKTNGFHAEWRVVSLACRRGLRLIEAVDFNHRDYPGYNTKCGFGGNGDFDCYPSKTYKFGLT